jgi:capsular exopolysaccharide synthesis family protein
MNFFTRRNVSKLVGPLVSLQHPTSFEAEQYRRLRHRVEHLSRARGVRVIAVTSAVASDGKTLTGINLAAALAQAPKSRILLIDADLRRPSVARQLHLPEDHPGGLPAALEAPKGRLQDFVQRIADTNLYVLPCPRSEAGVYEVLTSPRLLELLGEARRLYDYVVVDTPPIIPVPDGALLGRAVDGYLVIVAAHSTPRKLLGETLNSLEPSSVIGLVFNGDDRPLFGYYRSRYRNYFQSYTDSLDRATA